MLITSQLCVCDPYGCSANPDIAIESEGKIYFSHPFANGFAGDE